MEPSQEDRSKKKDISQSLRVLVADDDAPTRMLLKAAVSQWGFQTIEVSDGEQAWQILESAQSPQLVILDWMMPKLDGIALCEKIRSELKDRPYIYIILLTQLTGTANASIGLEAGADEFLSKPFNMVELRSRLSIGTRIVEHKNILAVQEKQLQHYLLFATQCSRHISTMNQILSKIKVDSHTEEKTSQMIEQLQLINELETELQRISVILKEMNTDH
jgi:DNA-binding response OmpR family regulator